MGKVVFWRTLAAAYRLTFGDLKRFVRLTEPWSTAIAGIYVVVAGLAIITDSSVAFAFLLIAGFPLVLGGFAAFAVAWHRVILVGVPLAEPAAFRIGRREWRFLGYLLGVLLIVGGGMTLASLPLTAAAALVAGIMGGGDAISRFIAVATNLAVLLGGLICFGRLALVLPAVAADEAGPMLPRAWARGRGNALRLTFGPLLGYISFAVVALPYAALVEFVAGDDLTLSILLQLPLVWLSFLQIAVPLAFLSLAYRQLVGSRA